MYMCWWCHILSRKKVMAFVKNKSKIKNGYQWSDRNNGVKKLCWEQSHKKTFGKGNTCTFIMTMEPDKKIIYGLNCSFNLKRAKVDEKGFQRYVQKMLKQEWDVIFMDPPYAFDPTPWIQKAQASVLDILIVEHDSKTLTPDQVGRLHKTKSKRYGDCSLSFYSPVDV